MAALKDSTFLDVVENDSCVQRKVPISAHFKDKPMHEIQQVFEDEAMARSIYAKGFGDEQPSTQFDIEAFFAKFGPTNSVRLRRAHDKMFKGSVFVEFDTEATQKAFLALDPPPQWKGTDLQIKSKKQYCDDKVEDIRQGHVQPKAFQHPHDKSGSRGGRGGSNDSRDWRIRREEDRKNGFGEKDEGGRHKGLRVWGQRGRGRGRGGRGGDSHEQKRKGRDEQYVSFHSLRILKTSAMTNLNFQI